MKESKKKTEINGLQYLRYMKTFLWARQKDKIEIDQACIKGEMEGYPVSARTVEDAINYIETGDGLRTTKVSQTDLYAMMEVIKHKENKIL